MSLKPPVLLDENNNKKENRITAKAWHKNPGPSTQGCFQHVIKGHNFTELETKKIYQHAFVPFSECRGIKIPAMAIIISLTTGAQFKCMHHFLSSLQGQ